MNELSTITKQTMTLKQITDLLEVDHSKAMIKVSAMSENPEFGAVAKIATVYNKQGQTIETYQLNKRQSIAVSARLNTALLMKVIDRWQELESNAVVLPDFTNPAISARAWADEVEAKLIAQAENEKNRPKVEFAEKVRALDGSISVGDFAKIIGTGQNRLFKRLRDDGFLLVNNHPMQSAVERGLLVQVEQTPFADSNGKSHPAFQTRITGKGQVYFEKKYRVNIQVMENGND